MRSLLVNSSRGGGRRGEEEIILRLQVAAFPCWDYGRLRGGGALEMLLLVRRLLVFQAAFLMEYEEARGGKSRHLLEELFRKRELSLLP